MERLIWHELMSGLAALDTLSRKSQVQSERRSDVINIAFGRRMHMASVRRRPKNIGENMGKPRKKRVRRRIEPSTWPPWRSRAALSAVFANRRDHDGKIADDHDEYYISIEAYKVDGSNGSASRVLSSLSAKRTHSSNVIKNAFA
ncbi:hypothetical protein NEUTE1DRAFT_107500 [Neurospora tetrasperma FGSC 2508]|uniref:Uncharacterized protein n=1 Tax=Neurospora tetrasperma (strain FGSC 2508 / ATCC MYA-4615 / P0657) TaxID=510951 RepID=F8MF73_NEUT8|nr:uncharacterized protein NEUTE1DRAFT_107500 [Neurospora tetrasperma FGSC 2508]EGO60927.1 hypothetical protein NEUTE1DRAFT_107500 [Neurospora tetrasperma FGSC 2508]EGZ75075.1 hypothetical protein NEUTE2DRAFT_136266 [Neurospora tetrasperma FGSC 2509]